MIRIPQPDSYTFGKYSFLKIYIVLLPGQSKHISSKFSILSSLNLTPSQMKTRAYEFFAIFEDAFDQLNIIHNVLPVNNINSSVSISDNTNCNPYTLNLAGIFP